RSAKETIGRSCSRIVPSLGSISSGTITWIALSLMTRRLAAHRESRPLAANVIRRPKSGRRYAGRNKNGEVKKGVNVGLSLAAEPTREGEAKVKPAMVTAEM